MAESTFIVTRVRKLETVPPIAPALVTFQMEPPRQTRLTEYVRRIIMAAMAYYDHDAEYVVSEIKEGGKPQTWYFAGDRFFAQS